MTDEAKALVEQVVNETRKIVEEEYVKVMAAMTQSQIETAEKAIKKHTDLIETQAREIERLREALGRIMALEDDFESNAAMTAHEWQMFRTARAALAGDSHDQ